MEQRQNTSLHATLSLAILRSLEILALPQLELSQHIQEEIEKNPLLEEIDSRSKRAAVELASPPSFHESMMSQIREAFPNEKEKKIACEFLATLDERGFLSHPCPEEHEPILAKLQQFDPPGVFARSLRECFLIQLERQNEQKSVAYHLVSVSFGDLLDGQYSALHKKYGESLGSALQQIGRLATRPADLFSEARPIPIVPDLRLELEDGRWKILVDEEMIPKLKLKEEYLHAAKTSPERAALRGWAASAKWLFRSLERRKMFLSELGAFLAKKQSRYLNHKGPLECISKQEIADQLGVHESTLSRALHGKFAATPRGMILLNNLVPSSPNLNAKELLARLIQEEDKRAPLTDQQLADALHGAGFPVARRTIAKYRQDLSIGDAALRGLIGSLTLNNQH